jgi:Flp pilus assembly protein CpaB
MRRGRVFFILAFVLILGLVGVLVVWRFLPRNNEPVANATPTPVPVQILYVTQNIGKGTKLDETMVSPIDWPANAKTPGMFDASQMSEVMGRIVKYDLQAGMPLLDTMLLKQNEQIPTSGSPWALSIPPGMVAVAVPMNRIANVAYAPQAGDHVNVIASLMFVDVDTDFQTILPNFTGIAVASGPPDPETGAPLPLTVGVSSLGQGGKIDPETGKPIAPGNLSPGIYGKAVIDPVLGQAVYLVPSEGQRPRFVSHMLIQDAIVLQVGNFPLSSTSGATVPQQTAVPTAEGAATEGQGQPVAAPVPPDVVTLIVRPQDAVTLNYLMLAQTQLAANISLVLRSANDVSRENVLPVTLQFLMEQYQIPVPARLPYSIQPRIDQLIPPNPALPTPVPQQQ